MSNVYLGGSTHASEFRYVLGDASGVYAMGDDYYDDDIPYMVKYDLNGEVLWQVQATYDGAEGITGRIIQAQFYGAGNLIVLGDGYDFNTPGHEGTLVSLVSTVDGSASDPLAMFSPSNYDLVPNSIAVGPGASGTGNVYVAGYAATASQNNAWLVNLRDESSAGYGDFTGNAVFKSVTTDATGNVYVGGQWYNGSAYEDIVVKIPSQLGPPIWSVSILPTLGAINGAVMVHDSTNSLFVTTYNAGHPRLSKLDAATGAGIWITEIETETGNIYGGSEGGVLTPDGDVIVAGWTPGPWNPSGPEGMLFSRVSGTDGSVMWSNALYTTTIMGGGNYFWNNNSNTMGLIGDSHFGAGGWQTLDGTEGAMAVKLPLDGTGQGTYGHYTYASYATVGVTTSLSTTQRTVGITTTPVTFNGGYLIAATVRANQFELDLIGGSGQQGVGNITNISRLSFATGGSINELVQGNVTLMNVNSAEFGGVSLNSWSPNGNQQAFSQLMWANTEIVTQSFAGFPQDAYNWVYTDSQGFHVENYPYGGQGAAYQWDFDSSGNFILPDLGNIVGGGNLRLQPNPNNDNAYLDIFLTYGPDIHIAGNGETVIIGRDSGANVSVNAYGDVTIKADTGNAYVWTFGTAGNLMLPAGGDILDSEGETVLGFASTTDSGYTVDSTITGGPNAIIVLTDVTATFVAGLEIQFPSLPGLEFTVDHSVYDLGSNSTTVTLVEPATGFSDVSGNAIFLEYHGVQEIYPGTNITFSIAESSNGRVLTINATEQQLTYIANGTSSVVIPGLDADITITAAGGPNWTFSSNGITSFPNYTLQAADGTAGQMLATDGAGSVTWTTPPGPTGNANTGDLTFVGSTMASSTNANMVFHTNGYDYVLQSDGTLVLPDYQTTGGYGAITASTDTSGIDIYTNEANYSEILLLPESQGGNVWISTMGETYVWNFDATGNLTLPAGGTVLYPDRVLSLPDYGSVPSTAPAGSGFAQYNGTLYWYDGTSWRTVNLT